MKDRNIRDVFGIDYLLNAPATAPVARKNSTADASVADAAPSAAPSFIERAKQAKRLMQMRDVLVRLQSLNGTGQLHTLLQQAPPMTIDMSELLVVAAELENEQLILVIDRERFGNWEVEITPDGLKFLTATKL